MNTHLSLSYYSEKHLIWHEIILLSSIFKVNSLIVHVNDG